MVQESEIFCIYGIFRVTNKLKMVNRFFLSLDPAIVNGVYWSESLNKVFVDNFDRDPSLIWQYFGSAKGFFRQYPGKNNRGYRETIKNVWLHISMDHCHNFTDTWRFSFTYVVFRERFLINILMFLFLLIFISKCCPSHKSCIFSIRIYTGD